VNDVLRRGSQLGSMIVLDAIPMLRGSNSAEPRDDGIDAGIRWLHRTHDSTGRRGCSKGYSLIKGWLPPYPETTGYIIGTLVSDTRRTGNRESLERAVEMADWEVEVQQADGGVMEGVFTGEHKPSTIFNTGMVMHGWLDLHEWSPRTEYLDAATRAGEYLRRNQDADGAWRGAVEHHGLPHTYCSRVSWALIRLGKATGDESYLDLASRQLDWVLQMQQENGWFASCNFKPGTDPNTHGIAYTLRGLLESAVLTGQDRYMEAVKHTSGPLIDCLETQGGRMPATFDSSWRPTARYDCLTGIAQLGGVWLRLYEVTGGDKYRDVGLRAVELAAGHQERSSWPPVDGALPGSYPVYGRYAPLQFPNWATKFLVDSLLIRERVTP
jgi:uncharacterized protein YyaL (SSP411 family)